MNSNNYHFEVEIPAAKATNGQTNGSAQESIAETCSFSLNLVIESVCSASVITITIRTLNSYIMLLFGGKTITFDLQLITNITS